MSTITTDLKHVWQEATTSKTWWHSVAGYAAIVVGAIDPNNQFTAGIQAVIIAVGGLLVGLNIGGAHVVKKAAVVAAANASNSSHTLAITSATHGGITNG